MSCTGAPNTEKLEFYIIQTAKGDREAFSDLYRATYKSVYGFILSITKDTHVAQDILHDVYLKVFKHASSYEMRSKPLAWIYTIARNLSLMKMREGKRSYENVVSFHNEFSSEDTAQALDRIVLETAINSLSSEDAAIVMLHAVAGFKHRQIALIMNLSLPAVLSRYSRALKKLKSIIGKVE